MKKLITVDQMEEIGRLANEGHREALIAYGADMYRDGICKGAIAAMVGVLIGVAGGIIIETVKKRKKRKKNIKSNYSQNVECWVKLALLIFEKLAHEQVKLACEQLLTNKFFHFGQKKWAFARF